MLNFRFITQLDTFPLMPRLYKLQPSMWKPVEARGELNNPLFGMGASLLLRGHSAITKDNWLENLPINDLRDLQEWPTMKRLLAQAKKAIMAEQIARQYLTGELGRAMISRLDSGSTIFWHVDDGPYHEHHIRFHVPLVTNPGCLMYSGPEVLHMEAGGLWYFNNRVRHSASNFGNRMRLHLIFEMQKIVDDDVEVA